MKCCNWLFLTGGTCTGSRSRKAA